MRYITDLILANALIEGYKLREQTAADAFHAMKARAERAEAMLAGSPDETQAPDPIASIAAFHRDIYAGTLMSLTTQGPSMAETNLKYATQKTSYNRRSDAR